MTSADSKVAFPPGALYQPSHLLLSQIWANAAVDIPSSPPKRPATPVLFRTNFTLGCTCWSWNLGRRFWHWCLLCTPDSESGQRVSEAGRPGSLLHVKCIVVVMVNVPSRSIGGVCKFPFQWAPPHRPHMKRGSTLRTIRLRHGE